jgi:hypothetical protein
VTAEGSPETAAESDAFDTTCNMATIVSQLPVSHGCACLSVWPAGSSLSRSNPTTLFAGLVLNRNADRQVSCAARLPQS